MKRFHLSSVLLLLIIIFSCDKKDSPSPEIKPEWDTSSEAYLKDTTLYLTKLLSLWQENIIPTNINDIVDSVKVRNITKNYEKAENVLDYLIGMTPKNPSGEPYDRFSFLDRQGVVAEEIQNARSTSYGMYVGYLKTPESINDNNNAYLYVIMVDLNSASYMAGIRRGDRIISINGNTKYDRNSQLTQNFKGINDALGSESMTVKWRTPQGQEFEKTLSSNEYPINPILSTWVKDINSKKVGYFAFSSFLSLTKTELDEENTEVVVFTDLYKNLEKLFLTYEKDNISELIIDLRYNGGGSTATAEYLANKIVPQSANKKRMYYYKLNAFLEQDEDFKITFAPVNFNKLGNLSLTKVYFLVTSSTASASELLINSLKPYMDVQVIGSENTYGKPVGFWGIPIGKKGNMADIYVTSFQMFNSANYGDYFNGLKPNQPNANEDFFKDFGDEEEGFIAEAIYHIKYGKYSEAEKSASTRLQHTTKLIKSISTTRASDLGMFKFGNESIKFK